MELLILVTGAPGTGKTTVARALAGELKLPIIEKDVIKEALHRVIPATDVESSHRLGAATYEVMYALASRFPDVILESNFDRDDAREPLLRLHPHPIEVFCRCDPEIALERFASRARGRPHFDDQMLPAMRDRLARGQAPLDLGGPVLTVDTGEDVDIAKMSAWVRARSER